jgi:hypothetical protein
MSSIEQESVRRCKMTSCGGSRTARRSPGRVGVAPKDQLLRFMGLNPNNELTRSVRDLRPLTIGDNGPLPLISRPVPGQPSSPVLSTWSSREVIVSAGPVLPHRLGQQAGERLGAELPAVRGEEAQIAPGLGDAEAELDRERSYVPCHGCGDGTIGPTDEKTARKLAKTGPFS